MDALPPLFDLTQIDQTYIPFPSFERWRQLHVDTDRWEAALNRMEAFKANDPGLLVKARDVAKRAAAIDTGAIEGLYNVDDGFTLTVATQVGFWQTAFKAQEERTRNFIEAQLTGYDQVIDLATKGTPMAEAWVRALHATLCFAQKTYLVLTEQGEQQHELPLGEYKKHPNHVVSREGKIHAYAPVLQTPGEMTRLVGELTSESFLQTHPVIQAAFAHYALVWVHPFADGNGRAARALASVYMYRSGSIPFMVLMEHKAAYLTSLRLADSADLQAYLDFVFKRGIDAFQLVSESLRAARYPSPSQGLEHAQRLHVTRGGYAHAEIDQAGRSLLTAIQSKATDFAKPYQQNGPISVSVEWNRGQFPSPTISGQRKPAYPDLQVLSVRFASIAPAYAQTAVSFHFTVPIDAAPEDEVVLVALPLNEYSTFTIASLVPRITTVSQLKLTMFLEGIWGATLVDLQDKARMSLKKSGFV